MASGVVVQVATVNVSAVLAVMVRIWPAPVPAVIRTWLLIHCDAVQVLPVWTSVVAVADVAVPVANDLKAPSTMDGVEISLASVPMVAGRTASEVQVLVAKQYLRNEPAAIVP